MGGFENVNGVNKLLFGPFVVLVFVLALRMCWILVPPWDERLVLLEDVFLLKDKVYMFVLGITAVGSSSINFISIELSL